MIFSPFGFGLLSILIIALSPASTLRAMTLEMDPQIKNSIESIRLKSGEVLLLSLEEVSGLAGLCRFASNDLLTSHNHFCPIFIDDDGEQLSYSVESENENSLRADRLFDENILFLEARSQTADTVQVTITAQSSNGSSATHTFPVTITPTRLNLPPFIFDTEWDPFAPLENTDSAIIQTFASSAFLGIEAVEIFLKKGGESNNLFQRDFMSSNLFFPENYTYQISPTLLTDRGLEFFILTYDSKPDSTRNPREGTHSIQVSIPEPGVVQDLPQPHGIDRSAYRLISIPIDAANKDPRAVLEDDLGGYDDTKWRFFERLPSGEFLELPNTSAMEPGKAFFLIVKNPNQFIDTGPGLTNPTHVPFPIPLHEAWNFIGNPFTFPVSVQSINELNETNYTFYTLGPGGARIEAAILEPFNGYAVFNKDARMELSIPAKASGNSADLSSSLPSTSYLDWAIEVVARAQDAIDLGTIAGVSRKASPAYDQFDRPEPPGIGPHVSAFFQHSNWSTPVTQFNRDIRFTDTSGEVWPLTVYSNLMGPVQLTFNGVESVPEYYDVWLLDENKLAIQDLRLTPTFEVKSTPDKGSYAFWLAVGTNAFFEESNIESAPVYNNHLLPAYPNPFIKSTSIVFTLAESLPVSLEIFDATGKRIKTLVNEDLLEAGLHTYAWDGRNRAGAQVAVGMYFLRINAGTYRASRQLIHVK